MFKFFGKLFGSDKALESTVDSAKKGLDKLFYTKQEKAEDAAEARRDMVQAQHQAAGMVIKWMESTQGQNLSRRLISVSVLFVWLLQIVISQIIGCVAVFVDDAANLNAMVALLRQGASDMDHIVMIIIGFYFAIRHVGEFAQAAIKAYSKPKA